MSEPQYAEYKNLPRTQLGLMSNETWARDPKMLGIHLARYKFVAKMLDVKKSVAEVGCGDGFYSKVIGDVDLYDFDPQWGHEIHDITEEPLPKLYDAIYSLDVMEHILPEKNFLFLGNISRSLTSDGVFIVGMPSLESQKYASEASKIGHVNCQSGEELKDTLLEYFQNVFLFGMNDETLHTGFSPMCHYIICVCAGVR